MRVREGWGWGSKKALPRYERDIHLKDHTVQHSHRRQEGSERPGTAPYRIICCEKDSTYGVPPYIQALSPFSPSLFFFFFFGDGKDGRRREGESWHDIQTGEPNKAWLSLPQTDMQRSLLPYQANLQWDDTVGYASSCIWTLIGTAGHSKVLIAWLV